MGLDQVPGGVMALTADLRILEVNRAMGELVGRPQATLVGEPLDALLSPPARILFQTHVFPALVADGRVEEVFLTLVDVAGVAVPVLLNAARSDRRDTPGFDVLVVRVLARTRWETDLLAAARELERERAASEQLAHELRLVAHDLAAQHAADQRNRVFRDAIMGVLGHELRTPITTIYGMSQLLIRRLGSLDTASAVEYVEEIHAEADRLRLLMEDLIVAGRAEGSGVMVAQEPMLVRHVVSGAVESERARASSHAFTLDISPGLPLVEGEETYLEQVVRNYLGNAVKYSPAGTTISVSVVSEQGGVAVRVLDEGAGLGDEDPDRLFELFVRAADAPAKATGSGIGLFVCRQLVEAMGGQVWAVSRTPPSTGAEFGLWLPAVSDIVVD